MLLHRAVTPKAVMGILTAKAAATVMLSNQCESAANGFIIPVTITLGSVYLDRYDEYNRLPRFALLSTVVLVDTIEAVKRGNPEYLLLLALVFSANIDGYHAEKSVAYSVLLAIPVIEHIFGDSISSAIDLFNAAFYGEDSGIH